MKCRPEYFFNSGCVTSRTVPSSYVILKKSCFGFTYKGYQILSICRSHPYTTRSLDSVRHVCMSSSRRQVLQKRNLFYAFCGELLSNVGVFKCKCYPVNVCTWINAMPMSNTAQCWCKRIFCPLAISGLFNILHLGIYRLKNSRPKYFQIVFIFIHLYFFEISKKYMKTEKAFTATHLLLESTC